MKTKKSTSYSTKEIKAFLIDTNVFIRWMEKSGRLSDDLYDLLNDSENQIFLSIASIWEIVIKTSSKKLKLPMAIEAGITKSGFEVLPIEINHILGVSKLPAIHKDPFDRIIISQAKLESLTIITSDEKVGKYDVALIKC